MGFINQAKGDIAGQSAREAYQAGQYTFVFKAIEAAKDGRTSGPLAGMAEQIQAIEAEGWALDKMAAAEGKTMSGERIALILLFRRR